MDTIYSNTHPSELDNNDQLRLLKEKFYSPSSNPIYLCGHSLGLQPKTANEFVVNEIKPIIDEHFSKGTFHFELVKKFSEFPHCPH